MKKFTLLFIALCCWSNVVDAQNVNIPDANFKAALVADTTINTNGDGEIQVSEAAAYTGSINVFNKSITDLTGIAAFTAIDSLNCYYNQLTSLDISNNTTITSLNCSNNQLTTLDVSNNTALTSLFCSSNHLTNMDVSNNIILERLYCGENYQLANLDVSINTALTHLACNYTQISSLDVSTNTALLYFACDHAQLTNMDISNNLGLIEMDCRYNDITSLDVSVNTALRKIFCNFNLLTSLDVSNNTILTHLYCGNNQITSLNLSANTMLSVLSAGFNQLTTLDVSNNTLLIFLTCNDNQLSNLDFSNNPLLNALGCQNNTNLLCLPFLPSGITQLSTSVSCLPNIPIGVTTSIPLCNSFNSCFLFPSILGYVFVDVNNNGNQDTVDFNAPYRVVSGGVFMTATNDTGSYNLIIETSVTENITIQNFNTNYFTLSPASIAITTINTPAQTFPNTNFRLIPIGTQSDAEAHLIGGIYRPGFNTTIAFVCKNEGNTIIDPAMTVAIDPNLTVLSSSVVPDGGGAVSNNMTFSSTGLAPFGQITIYVDVFTPISLALGSPIVNTVSIAITNEVTPANNTVTENTTVIGSYDPNDKTANMDYITPTEITAGKEINYTIRFQNTGTFPADFVIVTDTLDNDLNASTLELISTSHTLSKMTIATDITHPNQPNVVKWYFYNINLPDSSSNEAGSHGYIRFSIRPTTGLPLGTLIENMAGIVFDFNTPVWTNTWVIPVSLGSSIVGVETGELNYSIYPNPVEDMLFIESKNNESYFVTLLSINGQTIYTTEEKTELTTLDMRDLHGGLYLLQITDRQGSYVRKIVVE